MTVTNGTLTFGGDSEDIPPATYRGRLVSIETKTSDAFGDFLAWDFQIEGGHTVGGASSPNTGKRAKAYRWTCALLGRAPEKGEQVDLRGLECLVVVGLNGDDWPTVTDVLPKMAGAPVPVAAAAPVAPEQHDAKRDDQVANLDDLPF